VIAPQFVTSSTGSLLAGSLLENVGLARVDGFCRFPSFESWEVERCQRDCSATSGLSNLSAVSHATLGFRLLLLERRQETERCLRYRLHQRQIGVPN
jgi:hypothetical protein